MNHPNRSKQQQPTYTPDTSTKRRWEELAHEAIADAGEWKRQCRELQALNAELLAVAKNAAYVIQLWGGASGSPDSEIMRRLLTVIDKAESR